MRMRTIVRNIVRRLGNAEGAEIAEAALVLPVVFMFLLGIVWFGRAFNIYSTITHAAQQGAITAARSSCATCGGAPSTWNSTNFPGDITVDNAVYAVLQASSLDPAQIPVSANPSLLPCPPPAPPGGTCAATANNIWVCREVVLSGTSQPQQCGTVVSFQYPFQFYLPFTSLNLQGIVMTAQAQSRMEN